MIRPVLAFRVGGRLKAPAAVMFPTEKLPLPSRPAIGGALWMIVLIADVVAHQSVYRSATSYRTWEALLILVQTLLLVGVVGLARSGATGTGSGTNAAATSVSGAPAASVASAATSGAASGGEYDPANDPARDHLAP